jgi:hypothetical protein
VLRWWDGAAWGAHTQPMPDQKDSHVATQRKGATSEQSLQDPYQQQDRQSRPAFTPAQGQQLPSRQPQELYGGQGQMQPAAQDQRGSHPQDPQPGYRAQRRAAGKQYGLRGAEAFWYVLGCISFGAAYFAKLPAKKAACEIFSELQLDGQGPSRGYSLRGAEGFWYVLMCLPFGAGYFAKVWAKKAVWELVAMVQSAPGEYRAAISRTLSGVGPTSQDRTGY